MHTCDTIQQCKPNVTKVNYQVIISFTVFCCYSILFVLWLLNSTFLYINLLTCITEPYYK
jgi:hypothetical protein